MQVVLVRSVWEQQQVGSLVGIGIRENQRWFNERYTLENSTLDQNCFNFPVGWIQRFFVDVLFLILTGLLKEFESGSEET
jgi:hypothetical protein